MGKADRRARKRENKLPGAGRAGSRGQARASSARGSSAARSRSSLIVGGIALILFLGKDDGKKKAATVHGRESRRTGHASQPARRLDQDPTYEGAGDDDRHGEDVHRDHDDDVRHDHHRARPEGRAEDRQQLRVPRAAALLRRAHLPPGREGLRRAGRRPEGRRHPAGPATTCRPSRRRTATSPDRCAMANAGPTDTTGSQFFLTWTARTAPRHSAVRRTSTRFSATSRRVSTSSKKLGSFAPTTGGGDGDADASALHLQGDDLGVVMALHVTL